MRKSSLIVCAFVVVACSLIAGQVAHSQVPPDGVNITLPAVPYGCEFDVSLQGIGKGRVIVTNLSDTSKSVSLHVPGKWHQETVGSDLVTKVTGRNLLIGPEAGLTGIWLVIGNWSWVINSFTGEIVQPFDGSGQQIDVCEMIN